MPACNPANSETNIPAAAQPAGDRTELRWRQCRIGLFEQQSEIAKAGKKLAQYVLRGVKRLVQHALRQGAVLCPAANR